VCSLFIVSIVEVCACGVPVGGELNRPAGVCACVSVSVLVSFIFVCNHNYIIMRLCYVLSLVRYALFITAS